MNCPHCGTPNASQNRFCLKCGKPIATQSPQQNPSGGGRMSNLMQGIPQQQSAPRPQQPRPQQPAPAAFKNQQPDYPPQQPVYPSPQPNYPPVQQDPFSMQQNYQNPPMLQQQEYLGTSSGQVGSSALNIWGPFAGYGTRRRHVGWLMDGKAGHLNDLIQRIRQRMQERQVAGMQISWQVLTAKGVLVETRPYFLVRKGLATLGLNISSFGKDLFISIATYLKPPISNFRAILAAISALLFFSGGPLMGAAMGASTAGANLYNYSDALGGVALTLCCMGPIMGINAIVFPLVVLFSAYKWLTERDFFALLRVAPNEFNEDDLMAMEKAVEQTVRVSLDDIGLNPAELRPVAAQGQESRLI